MGTLKTTNIQTLTGSGTLTLGTSGETLALGSGVTSNLMYPAFEAYLSADQAVSDATVTKVQFDTEVLDTDNMYDNTTNYRFTPTVAGKYYVYARVQSDTQVASNFQQAQIKIYKNGSRVAQTQMNMASNQPENLGVNVHNIVDMNGSSDYLEIFALIDDTSGTPTVRGSSTYAWTCFGAYRIGT